jgi:hypothetical protein
MGCHAVWSNGDQAEAVVSALRMYTQTFFPSQMAKTPGRAIAGVPRRLVLRDIQLRAYEHVFHEPSCRWILTYVHEHARFNMLMWKDFTDRYDETPQGLVSRAHAIEVSCAHPASPLPEGLSVEPATEGQQEMVLEVMEVECPEVYRQALDFVPERFDLAELKSACARVGLMRDRRVLVAKRHRWTVAAAVLDAASDGLHLFGLLDTVRLFSFGLDGGDEQQAFYALLEQARGFYRALGKSFFVAMRDGPWSPLLTPRDGMDDLGEANLTILSADVMPEWFEHMHESLAPRLVP